MRRCGRRGDVAGIAPDSERRVMGNRHSIRIARSRMDARVQGLLQKYEPEMGGYPASLPREFQRAIEAVAPLLTSDTDLAEWAATGMALAQQSLRSWEAA